MRPALRPLIVNAVCLYIAAYLLIIMLHEVGHAVASWALSGRPVLYNASVENTNKALSDTARVLIAAAGPVTSLLQGLALLWLVRRGPVTGLWRLFWLYGGLFGLINFLGYLPIAPFVVGGDTGQIAALLHIPAGVTWGMAVLAPGLLVWVIGSTGWLFVGLLPASLQVEMPARTQGMRGLVLWPWLVGSAVLVLLALPAPHPAGVANMFMSPMVVRRSYVNGLRAEPGAAPAAWTGGLLQPQWLPVAGSLVLASVFKLLSRGIAW